MTHSERKWLVEQMASQRRRPARSERATEAGRARVHDAAAPSPVAAGRTAPPGITAARGRAAVETEDVHESPEARDAPLAATPSIDDATPGAASTPQTTRPGRPRVPEDSFWSFG